MKRNISFWILLSIYTVLSGGAMAQQKTIVDELNRKVYGQGIISVFIDPSLNNIPGVTSPLNIWDTNLALQGGDSTMIIPQENIVKRQGYRVQIFAGNTPRQARNEALEKERLFKERFPQWQSVVKYEAPYWRLRVGNFLTREEAENARREISKAFPAFGKEIYVVRSEVFVTE